MVVSSRKLDRTRYVDKTTCIIIIILIAVGSVVLLSKPLITGAFFEAGGEYSFDVAQNFTEDDELTLDIPASYALQSVKLSGSMSEDVKAKVFLNVDGKKYQVFNSENIGKEGPDSITGKMTDAEGKEDSGDKGKGEKGGDSSDSSSSSSDSSESSSESSAEPAAPTSSSTEEESVDTTTDPGAAGAETTEENTTDEQDETEGGANETSEILETAAESSTVIEFENVCKEACLFSDGLNASSYVLEIDVQEGWLYLSEIKYSLLEPEKAPAENQAPAISLGQPEDNSQINDLQNVDFSFTATDESETLACNLYVDAAQAQTNSAAQNNTLTTFSEQGLAYGSHNWLVSCSDGELETNSETRAFTIADTIAPQIQFVLPTDSNGLVTNKNFVQASIAASDTNLKSMAVYLFDSSGALINSTSSKASQLSITFSELADGAYQFNATAIDASNNFATTETRTVTINSAAPNIIINSPLSQAYNNATLLVDVTASDENLDTVWLSDGIANETYSSPIYKTFKEGENALTIFAKDTAGNIASNSATFAIDTLPPAISLDGPMDNSAEQTTNTIMFSYVVADATSDVASCSLYLDGILAETNIKENNNFTETLANGNYTWSISCSDALGNVGSSATRLLEVNVQAPEPLLIPPNKSGGTTTITLPVTASETSQANANAVGETSLPLASAGTPIDIANTASIHPKDSEIAEIFVDVAAPTQTLFHTTKRNNPAEIPKLNGIVYGYWDLSPSNLGESNIESASITFKISKEWITQNNINETTIAMCRYKNNWACLPTRHISEDMQHITYKAETPGFSLFGVNATTKSPQAATNLAPIATMSPAMGFATRAIQSPPQFAGPVIMLLIALAILFYLLCKEYERKARRKYKRKKRKKKY